MCAVGGGPGVCRERGALGYITCIAKEKCHYKRGKGVALSKACAKHVPS